MAEPFVSLIQQALASGSKSTVLKPMGWLVGLCLAGSIASFYYRTPTWFATCMGVLALLSVLLYGAAFVFFAITDKDALRSEKYSIQKMAIQKGIVGDDLNGFVRFSRADQTNLLDAPDSATKSELRT